MITFTIFNIAIESQRLENLCITMEPNRSKPHSTLCVSDMNATCYAA